MGDLTTGYTFTSGATLTPTKLNDAVGNAVIADAAITTAKILDDAVTADKIAAGAVITECLADAAVTAAKAGTGMIVQNVTATLETYLAVTANTPAVDDSVPLVSEGTQVVACSITPSSASSKVRVCFNGSATGSSGGVSQVLALFRDSTCIGAKVFSNYGAYSTDMTFDVIDSPATTSAVTYSVRAGVQSGQVMMINGVSARYFGGAQKQVLTLTEIKG